MTLLSEVGRSGFELKFFENSQLVAQIDIYRIGLSPDRFVPGLLSAIVILAVGLVLAYIAAAITRGLLRNTGLENRLAELMSEPSSTTSPIQVEKWIASFVFWVVVIFTLVAALQSLQLTAVSEPLQEFLRHITGFLPSLAAALLLAGTAWALATIVKLIVTRVLQAFGLDRRLQQISSEPTTDQISISSSIGNILFALILLLFVPLILDALNLNTAAQPVLTLLNQAFLVLLNVIGAGVIAFIGWLIARFVGRITARLLATTGLDQLGTHIGFNPGVGGQSLSEISGTVVYVAILVPTAIAALQVLKIEAISAPAIAMLNQILNALPKIFTAAAILAIAFFVGQFLGRLVTSLLSGLGFNNILSWLGLSQAVSLAPAASPSSLRTPSEIAGIVTVVGIVLFGVVTATEVLNLPALTELVRGIIKVFGQILSGLLVFAVGLYLANLAFNLITNSGSAQSKILGHTARISIIALISAMALRQIGVGADLVNLAFGLLLGALAVAIAIAFGVGGRDVAAEQVREWRNSFKNQSGPSLTPVTSASTSTMNPSGSGSSVSGSSVSSPPAPASLNSPSSTETPSASSNPPASVEPDDWPLLDTDWTTNE